MPGSTPRGIRVRLDRKPIASVMGRRLLDRLPNQPGFEAATGAKSVIRFDAPRDKVEALERALEQRFSARLDSIVYSPVHHLYFVKDDAHYSLFHTCNRFAGSSKAFAT